MILCSIQNKSSPSFLSLGRFFSILLNFQPYVLIKSGSVKKIDLKYIRTLPRPRGTTPALKERNYIPLILPNCCTGTYSSLFYKYDRPGFLRVQVTSFSKYFALSLLLISTDCSDDRNGERNHTRPQGLLS